MPKDENLIYLQTLITRALRLVMTDYTEGLDGYLNSRAKFKADFIHPINGWTLRIAFLLDGSLDSNKSFIVADNNDILQYIKQIRMGFKDPEDKFFGSDGCKDVFRRSNPMDMLAWDHMKCSGIAPFTKEGLDNEIVEFIEDYFPELAP